MVTRLYQHLDEEARELLDADVSARIRYIQRDRFILYHPIETVLTLLEDFIDRPVSIRPPCLALVGDAGSGKSTLVREFEQRALSPEDPGTQRVVYFVADAHPDIPVLQRAFISALDEFQRRSRSTANAGSRMTSSNGRSPSEPRASSLSMRRST